MSTGMMRISEWPKREFLDVERTRLEDFHRWLTQFRLSKWSPSTELKSQFVQKTSLEVRQVDGENWYLVRENESQTNVAVIRATHRRFDELEIYVEWFELADKFVSETITQLCTFWRIPFPDWMKPEQSDHEKQEAQQNTLPPEEPAEQPREDQQIKTTVVHYAVTERKQMQTYAARTANTSDKTYRKYRGRKWLLDEQRFKKITGKTIAEYWTELGGT